MVWEARSSETKGENVNLVLAGPEGWGHTASQTLVCAPGTPCSVPRGC